MLITIFIAFLFATTQALSVQDVVFDMTLPNSANGPDGFPHGVPDTWDWYGGPVLHSPLPPDGWTAFIPWGVIYRDLTDSPDSNTRVSIRRIKGYVLDKTDSSWSLLSDGEAGGSFYEEDISSNVSIPFSTRRVEPDSSVSAVIPHGYTWHFFPDNRASIDPDRVAGLFAVYSARLILDSASKTDDRAYARYLMQAGSDWWQSLSAPYPANAGVGGSRFDYITTEWSEITLTTLTGKELAQNPPPGVEPDSTSTVVRKKAPLARASDIVLHDNGASSPWMSNVPADAEIRVTDIMGRSCNGNARRTGERVFFQGLRPGVYFADCRSPAPNRILKILVLN